MLLAALMAVPSRLTAERLSTGNALPLLVIVAFCTSPFKVRSVLAIINIGLLPLLSNKGGREWGCTLVGGCGARRWLARRGFAKWGPS